MKVDPRFTYARAVAGHDEEFENALAAAIATTIAKTSIVTDTPLMAIRTSETIAALTTVLALTIALTPHARSQTALRKLTDALAKRLRTKAAAAAANSAVRDFKVRGCFDGTDIGGRA